MTRGRFHRVIADQTPHHGQEAEEIANAIPIAHMLGVVSERGALLRRG